MARWDMAANEAGEIGGTATPELLVRLGLACAGGRAGRVDRIGAHKFFNLAAARGSAEAVRLRREIAAEMSATEIAEALRQAREWLRIH